MPKSKKETKTEVPIEIPKEPLPDVIIQSGEFELPSGDRYSGFYQVKKKDFSIKREGPGTYTTWDGHIYEGVWQEDNLSAINEVTITYPDGSKYMGYLYDWKYKDMANYVYPDGNILQCSFIDNIPTGRVTLIDTDNIVWLGECEKGKVILHQSNKFYLKCYNKHTPAHPMRISEEIKDLLYDLINNI